MMDDYSQEKLFIKADCALKVRSVVWVFNQIINKKQQTSEHRHGGWCWVYRSPISKME